MTIKPERKGTMIGNYVIVPGRVTDRKIKRAKKIVFRRLIASLKCAAKEGWDDFFIVKFHDEKDPLSADTVGAKIFLPTVTLD